MGFTGLLVLYSDRGWKISKEAADASKMSADAAKKSADTAEKSFVLQNRPWLDTVNWQPLHEHKEGQGRYFGFSCDVTNSGPSAAWIDTIKMIVKSQDNERRYQEHISRVVTRDRSYRLEYTFGPLNEDEEAGVNEGEFIAEIRGVITFKDHVSPIQPRTQPFARSLVFRARQPISLLVPEGYGLNENTSDWEDI
jgi:hypothetical protein